MNGFWSGVEYVTLPVKLEDGRWALLYGGCTGVREGTCGELRVPLSSIEDDEIRKRLTRTVTVKVLDEGDELIIALRDRQVQQRTPEWPPIDRADLPNGCTRFARVRIGPPSDRTARFGAQHGGLWIRQRGIDRTDLLCSRVVMPKGVDVDEATSLNHACTLLSERYERHRISHTLNVYTHAFYKGSGNETARWYPLDHLRMGMVAGVDEPIRTEAWARMEKELGFRPLLRDEAKQGRVSDGS